ncbi:MAG TPA: hypothetical protein VF156_13325, partial [Agromyces sp.]
MAEIDPRFRAAFERVFAPANRVAIPVAELGDSPIAIAAIVGAIAGGAPKESLPPLVLLRPADLLRIEFRFVNLDRVEVNGLPHLVRRSGRAPAYLIAGFGPQHLLEQAFFDAAGPESTFAMSPKALSELDPQEQARVRSPGGSEAPRYPVPARIARGSRLVYEVATERIPYTEAGLLHAMRVLPLSVVPHAKGGFGILHWDVLATELGAIASIDARMDEVRRAATRRVGSRARARGANAGLVALPPARRTAALERVAASVRELAEIAGAANLRRTASEIEARFGASAAVAAVATDLSPTTEFRPGIDLGPLVPFDRRPPIPR